MQESPKIVGKPSRLDTEEKSMTHKKNEVFYLEEDKKTLCSKIKTKKRSKISLKRSKNFEEK